MGAISYSYFVIFFVGVFFGGAVVRLFCPRRQVIVANTPEPVKKKPVPFRVVYAEPGRSATFMATRLEYPKDGSLQVHDNESLIAAFAAGYWRAGYVPAAQGGGDGEQRTDTELGK